MTISFDSIPSTLRAPVVAIEVDASQASAGEGLAYKALLIGQKSSAGSAAANSVHLVTSVEEVVTLAGQGSMLHRMAIKWFANNSYTPCYIGVLEDDSGGTAASKTATITGTTTAAGTIHMYVDGKYVPVSVPSASDATATGELVEAALNADADLPIGTAVNTAGAVAIPFKHKGLVGDDLDIRFNVNSGESFPAGITSIAVTAPISGATNPSLTSLIAALGDDWYQVIVHPYTDATSLTAIETEMADRYGPMRAIDGVAITGAAGDHATLIALGATRNSPHSVIVAPPGENPLELPCEIAAAVGARVAYAAEIDPARQFTSLSLSGISAPAGADLFTWSNRDAQLHSGIATTRVVGGVVQIEKMITTYQLNGAGAADDAYLYVNTMLSLLKFRYDVRTRIQVRFPRHKLADDGVRLGSGQAVVTPKVMRAEMVALYLQEEAAGLVENSAAYAESMVVERNVTNRNRLDMVLYPDFINQLDVVAVRISFVG